MPPLDAQDLTAVYLVLTLIACGLILLRRRAGAKPPLSSEELHARNVKRSRRIARRFARDDAASIEHLRAVSAHEFEELVLTALARRGHRIRRNDRYTGDGGVDGRAWIRGRRYLIQAKRYTRAIRAEHIEEFARLCRKTRSRGLFVHTGTMGPLSYEAEARTRRVSVIHGEALERLVAGQKVRVGRVRL